LSDNKKDGPVKKKRGRNFLKIWQRVICFETIFPEFFSDKKSPKWIGINLDYADIKENCKAMEQPIEIYFDFPLINSDLVISLKASAELHHSQPYYVIDHFQTANSPGDTGYPSMLPPQELKQIERDGSKVWVHKDSERESMLSLAIGRGLDRALQNHR
jgi:hypothetical protein